MAVAITRTDFSARELRAKAAKTADAKAARRMLAIATVLERLTRGGAAGSIRFFEHKAFIHATVPRVACSQCGKTRQVTVPWARSGSGFTQLFDAFVIALVREMPVKAVADLLDVGDDRIWRVVTHYVEAARAEEDFGAVKSEDQQAQAMLLKTRDLLTGQRTQTINALRGHLAEHGLVVPKGTQNLRRLQDAVAEQEAHLPAVVVSLCNEPDRVYRRR